MMAGRASGVALRRVLGGLALSALAIVTLTAQQGTPPRAFIDGREPGWQALGSADFAGVNGDRDTWAWSDDLTLRSTGKPIGVLRSQKQYVNFELMVEWRHLESAGNSGAFLWVPKAALTGLKPGTLPQWGIEIQMLDHGFAEQYERLHGKKGDWFTTNGDVFAVGKSVLKPFPPTSPNGERSFPRRNLSRGVGEWNHYYVRAIDGQVRLWVNGEEVSGGSGAQPRRGYLCLEAEGAPIEFRNIRVRELP